MKIINALMMGILSIFSIAVHADKSDCQNMYVGRIQIKKGVGLSGVTFVNNSTSSSGSYWVWFYDWNESEKNAALSVLMAAKLSGHRVNLTTDAENGCDIENRQYKAKNVILAVQ